MQAAPNLSALRTPGQFFTGCGSRQRKSPTGGWANGIPLKLRTPSLGGTVDSTMPFAVFTRSAPKAGSATAAESTRAGRSASTGVLMGSSIPADHTTGIRRGCAVGGGRTYDAVIAACAIASRAKALLTFNRRHPAS